MPKLGHDNQPTMNQTAFDRAVEEGNEADLAGYWWVRHADKLRVAEWRDFGTRRAWHGAPTGWGWDFTRAEEARRVNEIIKFIEPPTEVD